MDELSELYRPRESTPGIVESDPPVGVFIPAGCELRDVQDSMALRTQKLGAAPIEQQAPGASDPHRKRKQPEADSAAAALVGNRAEQCRHRSQAIEPDD